MGDIDRDVIRARYDEAQSVRNHARYFGRLPSPADLSAADIPVLLDAVQRVESLHQPVRVATVGGTETMCSECQNEPRRSSDVSWPCPTLAALRGPNG